MPKVLANCHYNEEEISRHLIKNKANGRSKWIATSLQPVKSWKKSVEVVKGRILDGWAQKSPKPWFSSPGWGGSRPAWYLLIRVNHLKPTPPTPVTRSHHVKYPKDARKGSWQAYFSRTLHKGRREERASEVSEHLPTYEADLLYFTFLYLFLSFVRLFVCWLCFIAHPHLLVWVTSERLVLALVATSGSHCLNQLWKCPLLVGIVHLWPSPVNVGGLLEWSSRVVILFMSMSLFVNESMWMNVATK